MSTVTVRDATTADLPAVAAIYTHYVLRTTVTFNTDVRTPREWTERFTAVSDGPYHLVVAESDGRVAGFAETQRFRPKAAYDRSVELSVYVAPDATGAGIGSALYARLLERLESDERFHRAYAIVALPNDASIAFHGRFGFVHRGTLSEAGHKFGRYLDVAYLERPLDVATRPSGETMPAPDATDSTATAPVASPTPHRV
jgi:phosphinothricin acetyltransferase